MIRDAFVRPVAQATPARLTIASGTQIDDFWRRLSAPNKTGASRRESRTVASHATLRDSPIPLTYPARNTTAYGSHRTGPQGSTVQ